MQFGQELVVGPLSHASMRDPLPTDHYAPVWPWFLRILHPPFPLPHLVRTCLGAAPTRALMQPGGAGSLALGLPCPTLSRTSHVGSAVKPAPSCHSTFRRNSQQSLHGAGCPALHQETTGPALS